MPDFGDVDPYTGRTSARTEFEGTVDPFAPSVANGQISPEQWAAYQARRRRDALFGVLGLLGATTGLSAIGTAVGGGAASGALPAVEGGAPWALTPYAAPVTATGTGVGVGAGAGAGAGVGAATAASRFGLTPRDYLSLGLAGAGTIGSALSDRPDFSPNTATTDPNLTRLLQSMQRRVDMSEPLYGSIMAMANGLLPTQYQNGGGSSNPLGNNSSLFGGIRSIIDAMPGAHETEAQKMQRAGGG